jgi:hypothetical protein
MKTMKGFEAVALPITLVQQLFCMMDSYQWSSRSSFPLCKLIFFQEYCDASVFLIFPMFWQKSLARGSLS